MKTFGFIAIGVGVAAALFPTLSFAQPSPFATSTSGGDDWSAPSEKPSNSYQTLGNNRNLGVGLTMSAFIVGGRWEVANGGVVSADVVWRKALDRRPSTQQNRIEVGGLGRLGFTPDALLLGVGVPLRIVFGMHPRWETAVGLELSYTRISFGQPFFVPRNAFTSTLRWDLGYFVDPRVTIGLTPVAFSLIAGDKVEPLFTYEPGIWARFSPI